MQWELVKELMGWIPAVVYPSAAIIQLVQIRKSNSIAGVSAMTWLTFAIANVALYVYSGKYTDVQMILSTLVNSCIQLGIVIVVAYFADAGHPFRSYAGLGHSHCNFIIEGTG